MKRFYKHPVKPEWGFTYVDLDECTDEFENFLFSDIGIKKLKLAIVKAHLVSLSDDEVNALPDEVKINLKAFVKKPLFSDKPVVEKPKKKEDDDEDIEFNDIDIEEDSDWMDDDNSDDMDDVDD
ncbi:hypothetical protein PALB_14760 [Pseudoalteromonas luteoviolacea B = ATCC 29581]|nr:hypothetical protein PALB_14760 [Pseudoalteromonas luteoviolacea B = ATCC 29581]